MTKWLSKPETILFEVRDRVAHIILNRPEKRNAQNSQALKELNAAMLEADDLLAVRCIVLEGAGKDFCAGADLTAAPPVQTFDPGDYRKGGQSFEDDAWLLERSSGLRLVIYDLHKPVIAKVHGNCLAVGTDIALNCDIIIAADDARIGFPATRAIGSPANHMWLYHVGPQWAKRMLMTGDTLLGKDAERIGLVLKSVPHAQLDAEVLELAQRMALLDPALQAAHKRIVNLGLELMGQRALQRLAAENNARAHLSPAFSHFNEVAKAKGLKEALRQRDEPFGNSIIPFDD